MASLWNRAGHYIISSIFFFLFFVAYSQPAQIGYVPYFHTWCGLSTNSGCKLGLKRDARGSSKIQDAKIAKNSPSAHHRTTLLGYIFAGMTNYHIGPHRTISNHIGLSGTTSECMALPHRTRAQKLTNHTPANICNYEHYK